MIRLKDTYEAKSLHKRWATVYRGNPIQDEFNGQMLARVLAYLSPMPGALFLDAGCGSGHHTIQIARRGFRCIGIDISETILRKAERNIVQVSLQSRISLICQALEDLAFADGTFDVIYCRGVLMHIPQLEKALSQLCRVLRPAGKLVIMESNASSLETSIVRLVRRARTNKGKMLRTPAGLEFWSEVEGHPFVVRATNTRHLVRELQRHGVCNIRRWSTEFWDINRFPAGGVLQNVVVRVNQLSFFLRFPSFLSAGIAIMGEKSA